MNKHKTRIIGWHSFKGGSGRSLGLVNVAFELASRGRNVLCVDMDIESCGLSTLFDVDTQYVTSIIDILIDPNYNTLRRSIIPVGKDKKWNCDINLIASKYVDPNRLIELSWQPEKFSDFSNLLIDKFAAIEEIDYIFIDSRSGISEQLAASLVLSTDSIIVFTRADRQSRIGTTHLLQTINSVSLRPLIPLVVVSGVPDDPDTAGAIAELRFRIEKLNFNNMKILSTPFDHHLLLMEEIVTRTRSKMNDPLVTAYREIADWIERGDSNE